MVEGEFEVSVRARGVISGVGDGVFWGGACPTPECGVAGGHRVHRYGLQCIIGTQIYGSGEADIPTMTSDWVIADI